MKKFIISSSRGFYLGYGFRWVRYLKDAIIYDSYQVAVLAARNISLPHRIKSVIL